MTLLQWILFLVVLSFSGSLLGQQTAPKSLLFANAKYGDHPLVTFKTIKNRDLPLYVRVDQYAPFPIVEQDSIERLKVLKSYYAQSIQQAARLGLRDRAIISDSIAPTILAKGKIPQKGYRLFTSRVKRGDKLKRIKYSLQKGIPVLVAFKESPDVEALRYSAYWDGEGVDRSYTMLIIAYDSKTSSFQLLDTQGTTWGDQGTIWMSYVNLFAKAKEIVALKNPTLKSEKSEEVIPVNLEATIQAYQVDLPEDGKLALLQQGFVWSDRKGLYQLAEEKTLSTQEQFQIKLNLPKGRCAYFFTVEPNGQTTPAMELEYNPQDTSICLPPAGYYQFAQPGIEYFVVLISNRPIPRWRRYVDYFEFNQSKTSASDKLYRAFERFLIPEEEVNYSQEQVQAQVAVAGDQDLYVLPIILEWPIK
ncbi:MAG: hypothetical protein AAF242_04830 [Bacteroidota bacterium]